jgi:tryptophan synthase beta chain
MQTKYILDENQIPKYWYNVLPDLPKPLEPPLHPGTKKPLGPQDLAPLFPMELIKQEMSPEGKIPIPEEVRDMLRVYRPTPLIRALRLEKFLATPAKIFYKYEGVSPPGSHKPNTAIAQAYYNVKEGTERLTTETGAGQWGSSLAFACKMFGLQCKVYMVRVSYEQKPYRKLMMQTWGAECVASPSTDTEAGKSILKQNPDTPGSLGIAISEAVEDAVKHDNTHYSLGSVLNHVLLHQTIVGLETKEQLKMANAEPDIMVGCVGGGSNFAGFAMPFIGEKIKKKNNIQFIAVEPASCPSLTKGPFAYDFGDTAMLTPLVKMYTLGHGFIPPGIHAGGLRYHGMAPIVSALVNQGIVDARAEHQLGCFKAAVDFAQTEGFIIAPETSHAVKTVIDEALKCRKTREEKTIVFNCSGHGHFDMAAYEAYFAGKLKDYALPEAEIQKALKELPKV